MTILTDVTDASFDAEVLKSDLIVITDFWAEWSNPSHKLNPILEDLANEYNSQLKIVKLDIDENPATTSAYGVLNIPTLLFFKNGQLIGRLVGSSSKSEIEEQFKPYLMVDKYA